MNKKLLALIATAVVLGVVWCATTGRDLFRTELQDAVLICARPECMHEFTARIPIPFEKWPVACPKCGQKSGYAAMTCPECEGKYPFIPRHPLENCPRCDAELPR